ncbi:MAG: hypothetical protein ACI4OP_05610 [Candidatus Coprovivens sp.]
MDFFRELFSRDTDKDNILEENKQLKVKRKHTYKEMERIKAEKDELMAKYIEILEEKSKGFDQYLYYHDLYAETYTLTKEQKKEIAELKSEIKRLNEELEKRKPKRGGKSVKEEK